MPPLCLSPGSPLLAGRLVLRAREALQPVAGSPGDAAAGREWRGPEGSARGPFKQIQRLGLFCYSSFYSARRSAAAGKRRRARMRPAGRPPAGPPLPSSPKGEIPVCFPLGPKADGFQLKKPVYCPPLPTPLSFLMVRRCPQPSPGAGARARVFF